MEQQPRSEALRLPTPRKSLLEQEEQRRKMKRSYPGATRTDVETELTKKEAKNPLFYYQSPNEEK